MSSISISKVAPIAARVRFKGVLEAAYLMRFLLQEKSNSAIRSEMSNLFGTHWNRPNQERRYFSFLRTYVQWHHEADFIRYLLKEDIKLRPHDQKTQRSQHVRYLTNVQGLHGESEVVNDLDYSDIPR